MKSIVCLLVSAVASSSLFAALNPKEEVRAAIARLAEKPNYTWVTTTKNNSPQREESPEGEGRDRLRQFQQGQQGPVEAKTVRGGITVLKSTMNDGNVIHIATKDNTAIMKTKDGWKPLEDFRGGFRPRDGAAGDPGQGAGFGAGRGQRGQGPDGAGQGDLARGDGAPGGQTGDQSPRERRGQRGTFGRDPDGAGGNAGDGPRGGFGGGPGGFGQFDPSTFAARRMQSTKPPTVEAQEWLDRVKDLKAIGVGHYVGDLPDMGLRDLFGGGRRGGGGRGGPEGQENPNPFQPRTEGTKATVKFWTTGGLLTKYETSFSTKIQPPTGEAREFGSERTTEIRQIGSSRLDLPKDAIALLSGPTQPALAPAPRVPVQRPPAQRVPTPAPPAQTGAPEPN